MQAQTHTRRILPNSFYSLPFSSLIISSDHWSLVTTVVSGDDQSQILEEINREEKEGGVEGDVNEWKGVCVR